MTRQSVATLVALFVLGSLPAALIPANAAESEAASQATSESASESASEAAKEAGGPALIKPSGPVRVSPSGVYVAPPGPVIKTYGPATTQVTKPLARHSSTHIKRTHKAKRWLTWTRKTRK